MAEVSLNDGEKNGWLNTASALLKCGARGKYMRNQSLQENCFWVLSELVHPYKTAITR